MTLIEHLEELRSRIIKVALVFIAAAVVAAFFVPQIFEWLLKPSGLERSNNLSPAQGLSPT
jgi:sec-independent protein translocase protein TatC